VVGTAWSNRSEIGEFADFDDFVQPPWSDKEGRNAGDEEVDLVVQEKSVHFTGLKLQVIDFTGVKNSRSRKWSDFVRVFGRQVFTTETRRHRGLTGHEFHEWARMPSQTAVSGAVAREAPKRQNLRRAT